MRLREPFGLALVLVLVLSAACTPPPEEPPTASCEEGEPAVTAGFMGVTECRDGACAFGGAACTIDADCFVPLEDGDTLPAWFRPQGGIGTRFNVRIAGVLNDEEKIASMRSLFALARPGTRCSVVGCAEGPCECDAEARERCLTLPDGDECVTALTDQLNRNFPKVCRGDGAVHVEEIPVQFAIGFSLDQVDGQEADLEVHVDYGGTLVRSAPVRVRFEVGEFIYPVSFDPLQR